MLEVVRALAEELGGARAAQAVAPGASLEREVGLGSLERVELLLRLETAFGRALDDRFLQADTPGALARLIAEGGVVGRRPRAPSARSRVGAATAAQAAATVHESLWRRAQSQPARPHVYLRRDDGAEETITYGDLLVQAAAVAGGLRARRRRAAATRWPSCFRPGASSWPPSRASSWRGRCPCPSTRPRGSTASRSTRSGRRPSSPTPKCAPSSPSRARAAWPPC